MTRYARKYRRIARKLSRLELMETSMSTFDDLGDPRALVEGRSARRFLDFYGDEGLRTAFERYGLFAAARERGYGDLDVMTKADDDRHTLWITASNEVLDDRVVLVELAVRRDRLVPDDRCGLDRPFDVLTVDWLSLRHPLARFTVDRPRLPGQEFPGLGLGELVLELLYRATERLRLDGLLTVAEYFHNAVLYRRELSFFDPEAGGTCVALEDALLGRERLSLSQASWAVDWGCVHDEHDAPIAWRGDAQV
ncbi:MAG: hypothetical protein KC586_26320, partial [Myxococcales bacterium]|nr:hypothetical protein [Myxococcales bacterium]